MQDKVSGIQGAASARVQLLVGSVRASALVLMDRSDALVDRLLPPDEAEEKAKRDKENSSALVARAVSIPFKIPVRFTRVVFVKAGGLSETALLHTSAQKRKFVNFIMQGSQSISDKVVSVSAPGRAVLSSGQATVARKMRAVYQSLADAEEVVVVWVSGRLYVVGTHLRLPEIKCWTLTKVTDLRHATTMATTRATQGAFAATTRIVGDDRAVFIFQKIGLEDPRVSQPSAAVQRVQEEAREVIAEVIHVPVVHKPVTAPERVQEEAHEVLAEAHEVLAEVIHVPVVHKPVTAPERVQEEAREMIEEVRSVAEKCL